MPSSRLASKATSSALRAASSGWSRFVREMHHPRTLQMIAYAIVLLVLVVLVGMVCLASRKELFVVRPETDTLQTLSTLHAVEGFMSPLHSSKTAITPPTTSTTLAQTTTTGTPASTSQNGSTSPQCNNYMAGGLNPTVCNNTVAANRLQNGTQCQYYLFDKPGVYEGTIQVQDAKHITFCEKPGFLSSSSDTASPSSSTPSASKNPQEMMKCSITLDNMMQQMQNTMQNKLNSSKEQMNQSVEDMKSTYNKTMAQNKRTMAQNQQTIEDLQKTLNSQTRQNQILQESTLKAEKTANVSVDTAYQDSKIVQMNGSPSSTPFSTNYSPPSAEEDTNDELDGEDDTEGFTVHSPSSSGHSTHNNVGYTPTTAKQPPCNVFQYTPQSKCTSYTFPGSTKTTLVQGGMYVNRPSDIQYGSTQGDSNLTDTCNSTVQQFNTYADNQTQAFHNQTQTASQRFTTQSDDLKQSANELKATYSALSPATPSPATPSPATPSPPKPYSYGY